MRRQHNWQIRYMPIREDRGHSHSMQYKHRVCLTCDVEQAQTANYEWGRVVGYSWYPKIGRCKPPRN